jgi:hypothetical protein
MLEVLKVIALLAALAKAIVELVAHYSRGG